MLTEQLRDITEKCLGEREYAVIRLRYGLNGAPALTQREVAAKFGISRSYVSRIEKHALEKIRRAAEEADMV